MAVASHKWAMSKRTTSRITFLYAAITALVITCVILYCLMAHLMRAQAMLLLFGVLIVVWAILFSFLEVRRIASRQEKICGPDEAVDPDASRRVPIEPPNPYPHHETHAGSAGFDQGQYTGRLPGGETIFGHGKQPK
jgi:hypothetical protein